MAVRSAQGQQAVDAMESLPPEEKQAAVREVLTANPGLIPGEDRYKTQLWLALLGGLFLLALVAIICAVVLATKDKDATALVALASAVVAGVIGLFANPPTGR
jgi:hypothetical protein